MKVILASESKRRQEILSKIIPEFEVKPQKTTEVSKYRFPSFAVMELAKNKVEPLKESIETLVIAADTVVYRRGRFYGKPGDAAEAKITLRALSGKTHKVYTGVCIFLNGAYNSFYEVSRVKFKKLTDEEIDNYLEEYSPLDKAGAYGIQDGIVVAKHKGSYSNIVGLPEERVIKELSKMPGVKIKDLFLAETEN